MSEVTEVVALSQRPLSRPAVLARDYRTTLLIALVVFVVAYNNGGFGESSRDMLAIALWWALIVGVALGIVPLVRVPVVARWRAGSLSGTVLSEDLRERLSRRARAEELAELVRSLP